MLNTPTSTSPRPVPTGRGEVVFVGRGDELDHLLSIYDSMLDGRATTVLVSGEAGIGKSRLAAEFCDEARLRGAVVACGACVPFDGGLPYAPVMGILRDLGRQTSAPPRVDEVLTVLGGEADEVGDRHDDTERVPDRAGFARTALFEAILQAVLELAESAPVVLLIEDLQWCDRSSAQLIDFVARNASDARVLVVCTYRPEDVVTGTESATWLAELSRLPRTQSLVVPPLPLRAMTDMLAQRRERTLAPGEAQAVWARSQGNPFYAEELAAWGGNGADMPASIQSVIASRVRRLSADCQNLLDIVAVAGAQLSHDLLEAVWPADGGSLTTCLREAIDNKVLTPDDGGGGYRFRHSLLREALYESILPAQRRTLHRRLAVAIDADPSISGYSRSRRTTELAAHWWAAGDPVAALEPSVAAGEAARKALAFTEALLHFEHALAGWDAAAERQIEPRWSRLQLLELAAEASYLSAATERAVELGRAAVGAALAERDTLSAARCYTLVGRCLWGVGDSDGAFAAYRAGAELLSAEPTLELAGLLAEEARSLMLTSQHVLGRARASEAIAAAEQIGARNLVGHALNTMGCCIGATGDFDRAIALIREALEIAEETLDPEDLNRGYANLSAMLLLAGRLHETAAIVFDAMAVGEQAGGMRINSAIANSVDALMHLGRWDEAEQLQELNGMSPYGSCAPSPFIDRLPFAIRRGRFSDVEPWLATAHGLVDGLHDVQFTAQLYRLEAEYAIERDDPARAMQLMQDSHDACMASDDHARIVEFMFVGLRATADATLSLPPGDDAGRASVRATADAWLATCEAELAAWVANGAEINVLQRAFIAQARAEHSRLTGAAPELWAQAVEAADAAPSVYLAAYARMREAEAVLESRGSRSRAEQRLNEAWRVCTKLSAKPLLRRVEALAARSRLQLHTGTEVAAAGTSAVADLGLTAREGEILGYLAAGDSDRDIAERLFISKKTVSVHVSNILRKLQVGSRIEAGKIAQTRGVHA